MQDLITQCRGQSTRVDCPGGNLRNATHRNPGTAAEGIEINSEVDQLAKCRKRQDCSMIVHKAV
jgi:hypothetical protein